LTFPGLTGNGKFVPTAALPSISTPLPAMVTVEPPVPSRAIWLPPSSRTPAAMLRFPLTVIGALSVATPDLLTVKF
jgi:hypothetical protein